MGPYKLIKITGKTYNILLPSSTTNFRSTTIKLFLQLIKQDQEQEQDQEQDQDQAQA